MERLGTVDVGSRVRYGFRLGRVMRLESKYGLPGALVQPEIVHHTDGHMPHWVPLSDLHIVGSPDG